MIRHVAKLVWNRRRSNALVLLELVLCFLVLCGVLTFAGFNLDCWLKPLGFEWDRVWRLDLTVPTSAEFSDRDMTAEWRLFEQLLLVLGDLPEVEAVSPMDVNVPFGSSMMGYTNWVNGAREFIYISEVAPEVGDMLHLEMAAGRWLEPGDEALNYRPVVLTRTYARELFGGEDPLGRTVPVIRESGETSGRSRGGKEHKVVGISADIRIRGELQPPALIEFSPFEPAARGRLPGNLLVKLRPGVTAAVEEDILQRIHRVAPDWTVTMTPLERDRREILRTAVLQLATWGIVTGFLIVMVGLGLVGVLWQSVTRRTQEWGLRRALGAPAVSVRRQVLGELAALTTVAVVTGGVLFLQVPLLELEASVPLRVYLLALVTAMTVIYSFVILCGLYPSWLATRVHPAEALQYE